MNRLMLAALAPILALVFVMTAATGSSKERGPQPIETGAVIGVVNLMGAEVMHYHAARDSNNTFLKIEPVQWPVDAMLMTALREPAGKLGLTLTQLTPTESLDHARESCFVNGALADGLPRKCAAPLQEQASSAGVRYLIVMAPGLNNADHAGSERLEHVSEMMRGWGFLTRERAAPNEKPTLFNEVELLLVSVGPEGVKLRARQWGGVYTAQWQTYNAPADPHQISAAQLDELQPLYAALLSRQANRLLDQVQVGP